MSDECSVIESMTLKIDCSLLDGGLFKTSLIQVNKINVARDRWNNFLSFPFETSSQKCLLSSHSDLDDVFLVFMYKPIFWLSRSREMLDNFSSDRFSSSEIRERRKGHKSSWIKTISLFPSLRRGGSSEREEERFHSVSFVLWFWLLTVSQSACIDTNSRVLCWVWAEASAPMRQWRKI